MPADQHVGDRGVAVDDDAVGGLAAQRGELGCGVNARLGAHLAPSAIDVDHADPAAAGLVLEQRALAVDTTLPGPGDCYPLARFSSIGPWTSSVRWVAVVGSSVGSNAGFHALTSANDNCWSECLPSPLRAPSGRMAWKRSGVQFPSAPPLKHQRTASISGVLVRCGDCAEVDGDVPANSQAEHLGRLAARLRASEQRRFVGRAGELELFEAALHDEREPAGRPLTSRRA